PRWRLVRCTRCDSWLPHEVPAHPTADMLPAAEELVLPRRGRELRQAVTIRVIAVWRGLHAILFAMVAGLAIALRLELSGVQSWVRHLLQQLTANGSSAGSALSGGFVVKEGKHLLALKPSTLNLLILIAIAYVVLAGLEAVGLWRERRWAEYLTVIETAGLVPYEIYELAKTVTPLKVAALIVNLLVLGYLVWTKQLFGIGRKRHTHARPGLDPRLLFGRPPPLRPAPPA
ncbi:MAG: DUF2127 domain-containing protein, partial [Acidimicrobiales bacterium]